MWQLLFWGSVTLILYAYFGYPAFLYVLGRLRQSRVTPDTGEAPDVCLVISAHNEDAVIREKIENSLALTYPREKLTILVASDGCTDHTVDIAREFVDSGVRVYHHAQRRGKSAVLNDAVEMIKAGIVVFTDANSLFERDAIEKLVSHFADPKVGCVVGRLRYVDRDATSAGKGEGIYWAYEGLVSRLESRLQSVLVANGANFAVRREFIRELFPEVANDFQMPIDVADAGGGVVYEPAAVAVERMTSNWQEEFGRKTRIVLRGLTGFSMLRGRIRGMRRWQFVSHKLLRWSVGVFAAIALVANAALAFASPLFTTLLLLQLVFYTAAIVGWRRRGAERPGWVLYIPFYFTMVNAAAIVAMANFLVGRRQSVWEKAPSTRLPAATPEPALRRTVTPEEIDLKAEVAKN